MHLAAKEGPYSKERKPFHVSDNKCHGVIIASKKFFEQECVLTVSNLYTHKYFISVQPYGDSDVEIIVSAKDKSEIAECLLRKFMNDLIDYQVRIDLQKEFGAIKKRIIEYAFHSPRDRRV